MYTNLPRLIILFLLCSTQILNGQNPDNSANFEETIIEITTTPEFPAICQNGFASIVCDQTFKTYRWEHEDHPDLPLIGNDNISLRWAGKWTLTVTTDVCGIDCEKSLEFEVFDLTDETNIPLYLENAGFYNIPIWRDDIINAQSDITENRTDCELQPVKLSEEGISTDFILPSIDKLYNTFEPIEGNSKHNVVSINNCLCESLTDLEAGFDVGEVNIWTHEYFESDELFGNLFLKARVPNFDVLPLDLQINHFQNPGNLLTRILSDNENDEDRIYALLANILMPNPIGQYGNTAYCNNNANIDFNYISPSGTLIKFNEETNCFFAPETSGADNIQGAVASFEISPNSNEPTFFQGFAFNGLFKGYMLEPKGEIYKSSDFLEELDIVETYIECEGNCKSKLTPIDEIPYVKDDNGGVNFIIKRFQKVKDKTTSSSSVNEFMYTTCIPSQLTNGETVSFLTPLKSIITFPCSGTNCSELQEVEMTYGAVKEEDINGLFDLNFDVPSGLLFRFKIYENGTLKSYTYREGQKDYFDEGGNKYVSSATPDDSHFIYGLACDESIKIFKLENVHGLESIKNDNSNEISYYNDFEGFADNFNLFTNQFPKVSLEYDIVDASCLGCPGESIWHNQSLTSEITIGGRLNYCYEWGHTYVDKIAQVATIYDSYFGSSNGVFNKEIFSGLEPWEDDGDLDFFKPYWKQYLEENSDIKALYAQAHSRPQYFSEYLKELLSYVKSRSNSFWDQLDEETTFEEIIDHLQYEPHIIASSKDFVTKKKVGLQTLFDALPNKPLFKSRIQYAIIHLITACNNEIDSEWALDFIEEIGLEFISNEFRPQFLEVSHREDVMIAISSLIAQRADQNLDLYDNTHQFISGSSGIIEELPILEGDLFQFGNLEYELIDNNVKINDLPAVPYDEVLPIKFSSGLVVGNNAFEKGLVLGLPAFQAAVYSDMNNEAQGDKAFWVALDFGLMLVGVGEFKAAWGGANLFKRAAIISDVAGAGFGAFAQLINDDFLSPEEKSNIQIASMLMSAPLLLTSLPRMGNLVDDLDVKRHANYNIPEGLVPFEDKVVKEIMETNNTVSSNVIDPQFSDEVLDLRTGNMMTKLEETRVLGYLSTKLDEYPVLITKMDELKVGVKGVLVEDIQVSYSANPSSIDELFAVLNRPNGVKAWEKLFVNQAWRTHIPSLNKTSRYLENGLELETVGNKIIVKQNGVQLGELNKLDANDVYFPDQLMVKAQVNPGRHFDPDLAGGPIVKKTWDNPTITTQGISDIEIHVSRFGPSNANDVMISRLNQIKNGEIPITDYDKRFYTHELEEYARYKNMGQPTGVPGNADEATKLWNDTHTASLESYSVNEINQPLYHPTAQ